jgi:hypothetical protein
MKDQVLEKGFESLNDEIRFFKEVKPKILWELKDSLGVPANFLKQWP